MMMEKAEALQNLRKCVLTCARCMLCFERTNAVPGEGSPDAKIFITGEAPGEEEDKQGVPFCGRSGQLLDKLFSVMGLKRDELYIANVLKCRPPSNRTPEQREVDHCLFFLEQQIAIVQPKVIMTLGATATKYLLQTDEAISKLRGEWQEYNGVPLMPTFHPAYILRNNTDEIKKMWKSDFKAVIDRVSNVL